LAEFTGRRGYKRVKVVLACPNNTGRAVLTARQVVAFELKKKSTPPPVTHTRMAT
jgi:hypothetical protein